MAFSDQAARGRSTTSRDTDPDLILDSPLEATVWGTCVGPLSATTPGSEFPIGLGQLPGRTQPEDRPPAHADDGGRGGVQPQGLGDPGD